MLKFLYLDLGRVLLHFSVDRMCRQMAELAGVAPAMVSSILFQGDLQNRYERGEISGAEFHEAFCRASGTRSDYAALTRAGSDIFEINVTMLPVVSQLRAAGHRLGILSNTCEGHWEHCLARFRILAEDFQVYTLSYRLGAVKPNAEIYRDAARLAGVRPEEIFFTDDIEANVAGARAVGFDAVHYTSTPRLVAELRARGIRFNY
jgi:putative hydrolase of the HAD superfamily